MKAIKILIASLFLAVPMAMRAECIVTYTFDDGLADQYTLAYPMFRENGVPATFFVVGSKIGDPKGFRSKVERDTPLMTWEQVRDMATNGMEIASHGWAHAKYAKMDRAAILDDIRRNQSALKENAGIDCVSFASPFGAKKGADGADIESLAKECGILAVRASVKRAGGGMTAEKMNAIVEAAKKKDEWVVFMTHGIARGYDAWENPEELRRHLNWVKNQKDVRVLTFADAAKARVEGVKYRGVFINDEDWSLRPWAVKHFGKEEQIGTNVYAEVFSLMKKNGLNLLWPAMHEGGYEFSSRPENFELADKYGITVGTSHCEPMLRNNCYLSKDDKRKWSWVNTREFVEEYWREGVKRGKGHNVMYTIGMRGIHDGRMPDGKTTEEKRKILEEVFAAQCAMLPEGAPKLFVPYKEVLPIFNSGLNVTEDAIVMWTNDNFGYVRRVGDNHEIRKIHEKQGIYWHLSYHGHPHGYIHLCTTPPAFMWYELVAKCWNNGVRDVWMVNAGDVFQAEILLDAFGRFAADPEAWKSKANPQREAFKHFVEEVLFRRQDLQDSHDLHANPANPVNPVQNLSSRLVDHLAEYYNLGFNRKPEHMCIQWTTNLPASVKSSLLKRYHALLAEDLKIEEEILCNSASPLLCVKTNNPVNPVESYFRLVGFQVRFLAYAGIIHLEGHDKAYARSVIDPLYERWNKLDGGKWSGFWCDTIDERGGMRQPTEFNRWSSQMQWSWNEPPDPFKKDRRGVARADYPATAYRADVAEPTWLEPVANTPANGGAWTRVEGLGTSGRALALLPVKPGIGVGATVEYSLESLDGQGFGGARGPVRSTVIQFLPDFALCPGMKLGVNVSFDVGEPQFAEVPRSGSNLGEHDRVRNQAVQDNFIRVEIPVPAGAKSVRVVAASPGVVIDRVGVKSRLSN